MLWLLLLSFHFVYHFTFLVWAPQVATGAPPSRRHAATATAATAISNAAARSSTATCGCCTVAQDPAGCWTGASLYHLPSREGRHLINSSSDSRLLRSSLLSALQEAYTDIKHFRQPTVISPLSRVLISGPLRSLLISALYSKQSTVLISGPLSSLLISAL